MNNLRLVMFEMCNRSCEGCCNNDWDLNNLTVHDSFAGYDMIMLTGGEPMLNPQLIVNTCKTIREQSDADIILYTAKSKRPLDLIAMLNWVDGITLTLHEQYDVPAFNNLNYYMQMLPNLADKQLRLNVFSNVDISSINSNGWTVKDGIEWIVDCPLPEGETIKRMWN